MTTAAPRSWRGVNRRGFFHITQRDPKRFKAQRWSQGEGGHVVNVTTTLVEHADSKIPAGLAALTKGSWLRQPNHWQLNTRTRESASMPSPPVTSAPRCMPTTTRPRWPPCIRCGGWAPSPTLSREFANWRPRRLSPARPSISAAVRARESRTSHRSPGRTRTSNPSVNSRTLCQLSYRGLPVPRDLSRRSRDDSSVLVWPHPTRGTKTSASS